ncbi:heavy-metal-associated domain-containing protein [Lewinella sp. 4G2]|uniref:heavy-metal-associated domain-containing protein n=1 Tax=Lewinella sp. 4G2 TaxID=1803372 RepID=UPI0007DEDF37|nr:MauE/DoxX family redox-associated membrane protein [Lewinella sp. 4G2]OAV45267.1 hypothetical protein A3850_012525 [Lewinella sp. 4G2]
MVTEYKVEGMTCGSCVNTVRKGLETVLGVQSADVQLDAPQVRLEVDRAVKLDELQAGIGHYRIAPVEKQPAASVPVSSPVSADLPPDPSVYTYRPLIMIIGFILLVTILAQWPLANFDGWLWMRHFMAGFFIVFAFFKLLNLRGFADSYAMYDVIAGRWRTWGFIYPFIELGLGIAYLINLTPMLTNVITIVVLGVSSIGVIQSNLNKRKIKCACLGDVFNLPMSTVTIVEDVGMVAMAALMLIF